ncbi:hypothetical protein [Acinetobacter larvae]|uniref:Lipoprotein n=1 Tax=Acinetobacter larvae TaxID=1789224 RepID=A0A1B2LWB7_9GAMM|nr:hypothetical protein [Acinetobacter larvae]AOA57227.1 hypothetical protein BFG52_01895 [Acinetobacter larvae]
MRLKKLTLSLLSLSLAACATSGINNTQTMDGKALDQQAITGLNAMFSYPSFDYKGSMNVQIERKEGAPDSTGKPQLEASAQQQIEQYLQQQHIKLSKQQKQDLYEAMAERRSEGSFRSERIQRVLGDILSGVKFSYEGSVHYKQKLISLNMMGRYEKPNVLVQAKVPMILDLENFKFYINYYSILPFLVNKQDQEKFAYLDFSKFKDDFNKIDMSKLIAYLKEQNALLYTLAAPENIQQVALNSQDRQEGAVRKIRLNVSLQDLMWQQQLFQAVNKEYFKKEIIDIEKVLDERFKQLQEDSSISLEDEEDRYRYYGLSAEEKDAYKAADKLESLVDLRFGDDDDDETEAAVADHEAVVAATEVVDDEQAVDAAAEDAADVADVAADVATAAASAAEQEDEQVAAGTEVITSGLNFEQCMELSKQLQQLQIGDYNYCLNRHGIDILDKDTDFDFDKLKAEGMSLLELEEKFSSYASDKFVDAKAFKALVEQHQEDFKRLQAKESIKMPVIIDVALDAQGRAVKIDYDLQVDIEKTSTVKMHLDTSFSNYGKASPIDKKLLKDAKTIAEMSKGSALERVANGISSSLGMAYEEDKDGNKVLKRSLSDQIESLAEQVYADSKSYRKTYQAVFVFELSREKPEVMEHYSAQDLQEMGRVYAYSYADQDQYDPKGKELAELKRLMSKHHLESTEQYDNTLGEAVHDKVMSAIDENKNQANWKKLVRQYKEPKAIFAEYYVQLYLEDLKRYEEKLDNKEMALLRRTAAILAQTYVDARQKKLNEKSIAALTEEMQEYIDYSLYRKVFKQLRKEFK